jgi:3-oxoacyl-[acyl-carrier protein] reductase
MLPGASRTHGAALVRESDLTGRRALIIGGAGALGGAIASAFRANEARVVIADRDMPTDDASALTIDVRDPDQFAPVFADATRLLGGSIQILVYSAGTIDRSPTSTMSLDQWQNMLQIHLTGAFLACQQVIPAMVQSRWGRIILIGSNLGSKGMAEHAHYSAAKAGVVGLVKSLARELAPSNVLVNAIAPGPFESAMVQGLSAAERTANEAAMPIGRFGVAAEIAPTAVLLASDPGGNLYVGQTLGPNCGDVMA